MDFDLNEQQTLIAALGGVLIVIQAFRTGLAHDLLSMGGEAWGLAWNPNSAKNLEGQSQALFTQFKQLWPDFFLLITEIVVLVALILISDGEGFGQPSLALILILAAWAVFIVNNSSGVIGLLSNIRGA